MLKEWDDLPRYMRTDAVRPYYDILSKKKRSLLLKRLFDFTVAVLLLYFMMPIMIGIYVIVMVDSRGSAIFAQERITQYGRKFKIFKFRTMIVNAEDYGSQITVSNDMRVTKLGKWLRKYRLDELPQLINIILGDMSFCGTRPEVPCFVYAYSQEMMATLLLPAGVTSEACIHFKNEKELIENGENINDIYIKQILPQKMEYNLESIKKFGVLREAKTIIRTIWAVLN